VIPQDDPARCGLSWAAKVVSSGVHLTGRTPLDVLRASCAWMVLPDAVLREALATRNPAAIFGMRVEVQQRGPVTTLRDVVDGREVFGHARHVEGLGSLVVAEEGTVPAIEAALVSAGGVPPFDTRPTAPLPPAPPLPPPRQALLDEASALMFGKRSQFTNAFLVLHRGRTLIERYAEPFGAQTHFESWSMGKSIAASLVGRLHAQRRLDLDEPAALHAWGHAHDPRRTIRVRDLLNMASGLAFTGSYGSGEDEAVKSEGGRFLDHIYVYAGGVDSHAFCAGRPAEHPPGTVGRYRNCDPLLATALVRERCFGTGASSVPAFLRHAARELFDPIGAHGLVIEPDPTGHLLISGHDYGRARDWARLGQLYLQRGAWEGTQLLDPAFVDFVRTPAERAWAHEPYYGGFFITNRTGVLPTLPPDTFWMSGGGGQRTIVVPSLELVVVRLGHMAGEIFGRKATMDEALARLVQAVAA
jgi:CubicO group peptidase (beta-lactamase class C family)